MKKMMRKTIPVLLSLSMAMSSVPEAVFGMPVVTAFSEGEDTQMVSDPETVFINSYDGTVRSQDFNENWKFFLGEAGNAQEINFDDSKWRSVNLPHDYSIEQEFSKNMEAESGYLPGGTGWYRKNFTVPVEAADRQVRIDFDGVYMNATVYINGQKVGTHPYGYSPFSFDLTPYLNYGGDNVIAVKVDHKTPSSRWYSGSGIYRDVKLTMTPMVHEALNGTKIELPDLEHNRSQPSVHVETAVQNESGREEQVTVSHVIYAKDDESRTPIGEWTGDPVTVKSGETVTVESDMKANSPWLWSLDDPQTYVMETKISTGGGISDITISEFGFRHFDFSSSSGFSLNGEPMKLKGVCMHHDQGALGSEAWDRAIERQVEILKDMGCNAIRVTHNPASKNLIDICNEKGMLVIEEMFDGWHGAKNGNSQDYARWYGQSIESGNQILGKEKDAMTWAEFDLKSVIRRDWNAPCVISWSLGNEVMEGIGIGVGDYPNQAVKLIGWATETDNTRPVTTGDNKLKSNLSQSVQIAESLAEVGGLVGFNYTTLTQGNGMDQFHNSHPDWIIYGSETASSVNSRGVYDPTLSIYDRQLTAYDESCVGWGHRASEAWYNTIQKDYVAGEFVWTGFDYIGEPTNWNGIGSGAVGAWPSPKNSYFGIIDTAGLPKDSYYLYQSLWNEDVTTLHILPAWNEDIVAKDASGNVKVVVYSDAPNVELYFTPEGGRERLLGSKTMTEKQSQADGGGKGLYSYLMYEGEGKDSAAHKNLYRSFTVPYEDGTLRAVAKDSQGQVIGSTEGRNTVTTAGKAARLEAEADRSRIQADGSDLTYITVKVTDKNGNLVPGAQNRVKFSVSGNGTLVGVDNGWTTDHDSYQADNRRAFNGELIAIVQSSKEAGTFTVTASADGLESDSVTVETQAVDEGGEEPEGDRTVASYQISRNYYVKVGYEPVLPETLEVTYTDGTTAQLPVVWDTIPQDRLDEEGSFLLTGDMQGTRVSVSINMISQIAAILNYSTTVHVGETPILPESRQIVSEAGEILNIALPVEWDEKEAGAYGKPGMVEVQGTAYVFGEPMDVTASVRVQEEESIITDNVGTKARVEQTVGEPSDTLKAVNDGKTASVDQVGGSNPSRWSNRDYTKRTNNDPPAELQFIFDTQELLGQIKIYFVRDANSLRFPDAGKTKIYISNDKEQWTPLTFKETIPEQEVSSMVKCYTYDFAPVKATYIKFEIHNNEKGSEGAAGASMPTIGISEIELYRSEGKFVTNSSTELSGLTINGIEVPGGALKSGNYSTPMAVVEEIEAVSAENAAVTVLPPYEKQVKILTEAEDHSAQGEFIIYLEKDSSGSADDGSMDYDTDKLQVTVSSEETKKENGAGTNAVDGDTGTYWHTNWSGAGNRGSLWIQLELEEETAVDAVRYYPRGSSHNGRVEEYKVEASTDGKSWTTVATGNWENSVSWKMAAFDEPVKARFIRLTGVKTFGDPPDKFMTAAEVRVRMARETVKLTEEHVTLPQEIYTMDEEGNPVKPEVTVSVDGKKLKYGIDYTVNYENNDKPGTGTVIVKGIINYSGIIRKDFRIVGQNTQKVTVVGGVITKIEDQDYTGGSQAETEGGKTVSVKAEQKEGMVFEHWRTAPSNLLSGEERKKPEVSFTVPESSSRLVAVYREEGKDRLETEAYSVSEPESWFAFTDEAQMSQLMEAALTKQDQVVIQRGGTVEVKMNLAYSKKEPNKMDILNSYRPASPSDAEREDTTEKATSSDAKATPSDSVRLPEEKKKNPRDIFSAAVLSPLKAVMEEAGIGEEKDEKGVTKIGFWVRTTTVKKVTQANGNSDTAQLTDDSLPKVQVTVELLKEHRRMEDYQVMRYEYGEDGTSVSVVSCEVQGNDLIFEAAADGIYAVMYTPCFDVVFEDWDRTVLSKQRIAYGNPAEAPEDPKREGYTFVGWNREFDEVTSDLVIKARYEKGEEPEKVNKDRLEAKIAEIGRKMDALDPNDYTAATWNALEEAMDHAVEVLEDEDATQAEVNKAAENLDQAYKKLKRKSSRPDRGNSSGGGHYYSSQYQNTAVPLDGGAYVTEGSWGESSDGWTFTKTNGEKAVSAWIYTLWGNSYEWYYFDASGVMSTGWINVDGNSFYLNPVSDGSRGKMVTGWQLIDGKYYYFNPVSDGTRGALYKNTVTPDGYKVGMDGVWIQ